MFFYKNAVNVFSDASTKIINPGTNKNKFLTCPGFVTTINGSIINEGYDIVEATVNYAELYAIRMGRSRRAIEQEISTIRKKLKKYVII